MATYSEITAAEIAAGKPFTTALAIKYRNNPIALYENTVVAGTVTVNVSNATNVTVDVTEFNVSASANSVWRIHYGLKWATGYIVAGPTYVPFLPKVYASSLAATPGYCAALWHDQDAAGAGLFAAESVAVASEFGFSWDGAGVTGAPWATCAEIDALVYVGASATTIKFGFRNSVAVSTAAVVYAGSAMLAQEISGTT